MAQLVGLAAFLLPALGICAFLVLGFCKLLIMLIGEDEDCERIIVGTFLYLAPFFVIVMFFTTCFSYIFVYSFSSDAAIFELKNFSFDSGFFVMTNGITKGKYTNNIVIYILGFLLLPLTITIEGIWAWLQLFMAGISKAFYVPQYIGLFLFWEYGGKHVFEPVFCKQDEQFTTVKIKNPYEINSGKSTGCSQYFDIGYGMGKTQEDAIREGTFDPKNPYNDINFDDYDDDDYDDDR